jgi:pimeloyl-ACP methyl ester carboxylesterase
VGHSLGGAVAATLAVERPDLVQAVVEIDSAHLERDEIWPFVAAGLEACDQNGWLSLNTFDTSAGHSTPPSLTKWYNRRQVGTPEHALRAIMLDLTGGSAPYLLQSGSQAYLAQVRQPVLSFYVDPARVVMAAAVFTHACSRGVSSEGSGHWIHHERPDDVNAIIDDWLNTLAS